VARNSASCPSVVRLQRLRRQRVTAAMSIRSRVNYSPKQRETWERGGKFPAGGSKSFAGGLLRSTRGGEKRRYVTATRAPKVHVVQNNQDVKERAVDKLEATTAMMVELYISSHSCQEIQNRLWLKRSRPTTGSGWASGSVRLSVAGPQSRIVKRNMRDHHWWLPGTGFDRITARICGLRSTNIASSGGTKAKTISSVRRW
jgi:hypothetical protein